LLLTILWSVQHVARIKPGRPNHHLVRTICSDRQWTRFACTGRQISLLVRTLCSERQTNLSFCKNILFIHAYKLVIWYENLAKTGGLIGHYIENFAQTGSTAYNLSRLHIKIDGSIINTYHSLNLLSNYPFSKIIDLSVAKHQNCNFIISLIFDFARNYCTMASIDYH